MVKATWGECLKHTIRTRDSWMYGTGAKSAITYANYFTDFKNPGFPVEKITIPVMDEFRKHLRLEGRAKATINRAFSSVKTVLNHCKDHGLIFFDIPKFKNIKEDVYQRIYFTKEQVEQICTAAVEIHGHQDLADIVNFAAYTGMRQSEILRLTAARVDFLSNCIHVGARKDDTTKSGAYRAIPIHRSLIPMLQERTKDKGARERVFGNDWGKRDGKDGNLYAKDRLLRAFKKVINNYPVNLASEDGYCFHSLRHSFGTWHFAHGTKPRNLMDMMGHANIATTLVYGHATDKGKQHDINNI